MLDGLEAVEFAFGKMQKAGRFDAEYACRTQAPLIKKIERRGSFKPLKDFIEYISSGHTPYKHNLSEGDVGFITVECVDDLLLNKERLKRITTEQYEKEFKKNRIVAESVVCTIKRRICKAYPFVDEPEKPLAMNQDVAFIIPKAGVRAAFLAAYLSCEVGKTLAVRQQTEQMNPYISVENLSRLPVHVPALDFQLVVESVFRKAQSKLNLSRASYAEAESLLLEELGLKDWQPPEEKIAVKSFAESFGSRGRIDAEFYQPKYQELLAKLSRSGARIGDLSKLSKRNFDPKGISAFKYIEIGSLTGEGHAEAEEVLTQDAPSRAQWVVKKGDVITSTVRPIRRLSALIEPEQDDCVCSSGFAVLTPRQIESEVLLTFLRAPIVCEILDLYTTASMYPAISTDDLLNIPITLPSVAAREKIVRGVQNSRQARRDSKRLLEVAKRGVEIAIEQDEATALAWMDEQTRQMDLS